MCILMHATEKDRIKLYNTLANRWVRPTNLIRMVIQLLNIQHRIMISYLIMNRI